MEEPLPFLRLCTVLSVHCHWPTNPASNTASGVLVQRVGTGAVFSIHTAQGGWCCQVIRLSQTPGGDAISPCREAPGHSPLPRGQRSGIPSRKHEAALSRLRWNAHKPFLPIWTRQNHMQQCNGPMTISHFLLSELRTTYVRSQSFETFWEIFLFYLGTCHCTVSFLCLFQAGRPNFKSLGWRVNLLRHLKHDMFHTICQLAIHATKPGHEDNWEARYICKRVQFIWEGKFELRISK